MLFRSITHLCEWSTCATHHIFYIFYRSSLSDHFSDWSRRRWICPFSERKQLNDAWITNFYVNIESEAVGMIIAHSYGSFIFCQISFCQESLAMLNLLHPSDRGLMMFLWRFWFLCLVSPPFLIWVCLSNLMFTFVRVFLYASAVTQPHCHFTFGLFPCLYWATHLLHQTHLLLLHLPCLNYDTGYLGITEPA